MSIGDTAYLQSGVAASVYGTVAALLTNDVKTQTQPIVLIPIAKSVDNGTSVQVIAFAPFYIDSADQSSKLITGHFVDKYNYSSPTQGTGVSPYYGGTFAPRLAF